MIKELISELKDIREQIKDYEMRLRTLKEKKIRLQVKIIEEMNVDGIRRIDHESSQVILVKKKSLNIVNELQATMSLKSLGVPERNYMKIDNLLLKGIAKDLIKDGKQINGFEEIESEDLTIRERK